MGDIAIKYSDANPPVERTNYIFISFTQPDEVKRAINYRMPFRYAEFWGVRDKTGSIINQGSIKFGYKIDVDQNNNPLYFFGRDIHPGSMVPYQIDNDFMKRDLSEFYFKASNAGDGVLILYWY